ncbi:MAG: hypothetical protein AAGH99_01625 [Planctomycetota bacterium]
MESPNISQAVQPQVADWLSQRGYEVHLTTTSVSVRKSHTPGCAQVVALCAFLVFMTWVVNFIPPVATAPWFSFWGVVVFLSTVSFLLYLNARLRGYWFGYDIVIENKSQLLVSVNGRPPRRVELTSARRESDFRSGRKIHSLYIDLNDATYLVKTDQSKREFEVLAKLYNQVIASALRTLAD